MRILPVNPILLAAFLSLLVGCKEADEIKVEDVTHPDREEIRLRVAIMKRDQTVFFFRLSGPALLVKEHEGAFDTLVGSARFDDKKDPPLTLSDPKGWKKDLAPPPGGLRVAGYRIDAQPKGLEIAVTQMSAPEYDLMKNMHRWQKQVNLPPAEVLADLDPFIKREKIGDQEVTWVNLLGRGVHTVSKPPEPVAQNKGKFLPPMGIKGKGPAGGDGGIPFKYTAPEGWVRKPPRQFVVDVYEVAAGGQRAEVTLSSAGGSIASNINRWRVEQVGLPKLSPDRKAEQSAEMKLVAGVNSYYVDLANPGGPQDIRILAVIIPAGQSNFFVKMTGPHDLVGKHKKAFETFVESFKRDAK